MLANAATSQLCSPVGLEPAATWSADGVSPTELYNWLFASGVVAVGQNGGAIMGSRGEKHGGGGVLLSAAAACWLGCSCCDTIVSVCSSLDGAASYSQHGKTM